MKKLSKLKKTRSEAKPETSASQKRVTNDSVSQHREEVLKKGRRFKYPFYKSKHRVAIISIILTTISLLLLTFFTGYQLYMRQSTGIFTYRVTQILPFPVASVDKTKVSYESYLFELRQALYWEETRGSTDMLSEDGKRIIEYRKRQSLDRALMNAITRQLANQHDISVTDDEVDAAIERINNKISKLGGNLEIILPDELNLNESELRRLQRERILREKVAKTLDKQSPTRAQAAHKALQGKDSFAEVALKYSDDEETKQNGGDIGIVERGRANVPEEVEAAIFQLKKGQTSDVVEAGQGYYIVRVADKPSDTRAEVSIIVIKVKDMMQYLDEYRKNNKITEYIKIEDNSPQGSAPAGSQPAE